MGGVDFVYLPEDNANEGEPEQYRRLREIFSDLKLASLFDMRIADRRGYWLVVLITFIALPIRGLLAASGTGLQKRSAEGRCARKR